MINVIKNNKIFYTYFISI